MTQSTMTDGHSIIAEALRLPIVGEYKLVGHLPDTTICMLEPHFIEKIDAIIPIGLKIDMITSQLRTTFLDLRNSTMRFRTDPTSLLYYLLDRSSSRSTINSPIDDNDLNGILWTVRGDVRTYGVYVDGIGMYFGTASNDVYRRNMTVNLPNIDLGDSLITIYRILNNLNGINRSLASLTDTITSVPHDSLSTSIVNTYTSSDGGIRSEDVSMGNLLDLTILPLDWSTIYTVPVVIEVTGIVEWPDEGLRVAEDDDMFYLWRVPPRPIAASKYDTVQIFKFNIQYKCITRGMWDEYIVVPLAGSDIDELLDYWNVDDEDDLDQVIREALWNLGDSIYSDQRLGN